MWNVEYVRPWLCLLVALTCGVTAWKPIQADPNPQKFFCEEQESLFFVDINPKVLAALKRCDQPLDIHERAACLVLNGLKRLSEEEKEPAIKAFEKALDLYEQSQDSWGAWISHIQLGISKNEGHASIFHFRAALEVLESFEKKPTVAYSRSLRVLAEIVDDASLFAIQLIEPKSLAQALAPYTIRATKQLLGVTLGCQKRFDEAEELFRQVLMGMRSGLVAPNESEILEYLSWLERERGTPIEQIPTGWLEDEQEPFQAQTSSGALIMDSVAPTIPETCQSPQLEVSQFFPPDFDAAEREYWLGVSMGCQSQFQEAERRLLRALEESRRGSGRFDESKIHLHLGLFQLQQGRIDAAVGSFRKTLSVARSRRSPAVARAAAQRLSMLYGAAGRLRDALDAIEDALRIAASDPSTQAWMWVERAAFFARAGRLPDARQDIDTAREVARLTEIPWLQEAVLISAGARLRNLEFFEDAARYVEEAVRLLENEALDESGRGMLEEAHYQLASIYGGLGLGDLQMDSMADLHMMPESGTSPERLRFLYWIRAGELVMKSPESEIAMDNFLAAGRLLVESASKSGDPRWRDMARVLGPSHKIIEGMSHLEESADEASFLLEQMGSYPEAPEIDFLLSMMARFLKIAKEGHKEESIRAAGEILKELSGVFQPSALLEAQSLILTALGDNLAESVPDETAIADCKRAIDIFESLLHGMQVEEAIAGLINNDGHMLYSAAVEILGRVDAAAAFSYAERGRALTLRRLLGGSRRRVHVPGSREREILSAIAELERNGEKTSNRHQLESLRQEFERARLQRKLTQGTAVGPGSDELITVDQLRSQLPLESTLLAYYHGFRTQGAVPRLWIWAVDRESVEMTSVPMPEDEWADLDCQIQSWLRQGARVPADGTEELRGVRLVSDCKAGNDSSRALYQKLIAPIAPHLRHRHLVIVPHGPLYRLPFAALQDPKTGRYLIEDFELGLVPSVSAFSLLSQRREAPTGESLVLGDLELPGARREAEAVAALLGISPLLGEQATESLLYDREARLRLLHVASHGEYMPGSPLFSRMLLASDGEHDGALEVHEVLDRLDLSGPELVVLSGCDTALGKAGPGDDVIGLPRAFFAAGSRTVISTLWPVDDAASARLMVSFYERYLSGDATAAEALREAQLDLLGQESTAPPYYWAGFTLIGDPDSRWRPTPNQL